MLTSSGVLFVLVGTQWLHGAPRNENNPEISIAERFQKNRGAGGRNSQDVISPLVKQATAYALYLTPPKPPAPKKSARPSIHKQPLHRSVGTTPKFRLLSTTYYRSSPGKSLALVSEPGKGDHWIKKGERLGHFVLERVEKGAIVYRDGNQLREMKVAMSGKVQLGQTKSNISASTQTIKPNLRLLNRSQPSDVE
jgi:hypothetical protein